MSCFLPYNSRSHKNSEQNTKVVATVASTGCMSVSLKSKLFLRPNVEDESPLGRTFLGGLIH